MKKTIEQHRLVSISIHLSTEDIRKMLIERLTDGSLVPEVDNNLDQFNLNLCYNLPDSKSMNCRRLKVTDFIPRHKMAEFFKLDEEIAVDDEFEYLPEHDGCTLFIKKKVEG